MGKNKKGINNKVVTLYEPDGYDKFYVYVTYTIFNEKEILDDSFGDSQYINREDIDIKHYESNSDEEMPDWVTEDLIYDSLVEELEDEVDDWENENELKDLEDDTDEEDDENW